MQFVSDIQAAGAFQGTCIVIGASIFALLGLKVSLNEKLRKRYLSLK